jgi:competence protein ComEA
MKRTTKLFATLAAAAMLIAGIGMAQAATSFDGVVNLNTASAEQLTEIPGIGPAKARAIIEHRSETPFKTVEDVKLVKGIGDKLFAKISSNLTVDGQTSLGGAPNAQPGSGAKVKK